MAKDFLCQYQAKWWSIPLNSDRVSGNSPTRDVRRGKAAECDRQCRQYINNLTVIKFCDGFQTKKNFMKGREGEK